MLALKDGTRLIQSAAIIEYLEETHPEPTLLPKDPVFRARVRGVVSLIGSDIHTLHNVASLTWVRSELAASEPAMDEWIATWIKDGLAAVEALIDECAFAFGESPDLADAFLIPQIYAACRFDVDLSALPKIERVEHSAVEHPAFITSDPDNQNDAPKSSAQES